MIKIKLMLKLGYTRVLALDYVEEIKLKLRNNLDCSLYLIDFDLPNRIYRKILFDKNTNVNKKFKSGRTALILDCIQDDTLKVLLLLSHPKINVNMKDVKGNTALMYACKYNDLKAILLLQRLDINVSIKDEYKKTAFDYTKSNQIKNLIKNHPSYKGL